MLHIEFRVGLEGFCDFATSDLGESLLRSLNGLAGIESKAQELLRTQTEQDTAIPVSTGK